MSDAKENSSGGLSVTTLVIASLSSLAAAIFIHEFWQGGAILGAAITPIIVSIVSELLRRPTDRVTAVVVQRRPTTSRAATARAERAPAPPAREDPFGLRDDRVRRVRRRRLGIGIATGLAAFALAGFLLTGTELVIGNPLGGGGGGTASGGGGGTTIFGGGSRSDEDRERERTQPERDGGEEGRDAPQDEAPAPEGETPEQPAPDPAPDTAPDGTTPAPDGTTPAPGEPAPAPTPQPTPPAPEAPAPDPGGAAPAP